MSDTLLHPLVAKALADHNIKHTTLACDPDLADTAAFCEAYGFRAEQSANTIIVASRTEPVQYAACLVLASHKLDVNKAVRNLMQTRKISFASAEQTVALTDMQIGGVVIIGLPVSVPIYVDAAVMEQDEIILGGGNRSSKLALKPGELQKVPNLQVIPDLALARS